MSKNSFNRLLSFLSVYKLTFTITFLFSVLYVAATLCIPVMIGDAVNAAIGEGNVNFNIILKNIIIIFMLSILASISQWISGVSARKMSAHVVRDMCKKAFAAINNAPLKTLDKHLQGDLKSRIVNDAGYVGEGIMQALLQLLPAIATIIGTLVIMLVLNAAITIVVVFVTPVSIIFASFMAKKTAKYFKAQSVAQGKISSYINESVSSQSLIHTFGHEEECFKQFDEMANELYESGVKSTFYSSVTNPGTRFVNAIVYTFVGVIGAVVTVSGAMSVGSLVSFLTYANQYTKPFNEVSGVLTQVQSAIAGFDRLLYVIDMKSEQEKASDTITITDCKGKVKLTDVSFSYTEKRPFMQNINLTAKPGSKIAIVGPTGCGKTTLINLLMRFYDIDSGTITVDNVDCEKMKRNELRNLYGMVLQETWLKNATVKQNIAYGKKDANLEQIIQAAKAVHAHSFIKRLPNGYDTVIEPEGGNLSAGQKQLLCIARIMLCKPQMLILDEATSNIDTRTEMIVQKAFEKLMENKTSFIVAHRLSTIQNADEIIVMKDGKIIEQGTHEHLLCLKGFYTNLFNSMYENKV